MKLSSAFSVSFLVSCMSLVSAGTYYWGGGYGTPFWIDLEENPSGVHMLNGIKDEKDWGQIPYSEILEHFTSQPLVD